MSCAVRAVPVRVKMNVTPTTYSKSHKKSIEFVPVKQNSARVIDDAEQNYHLVQPNPVVHTPRRNHHL